MANTAQNLSHQLSHAQTLFLIPSLEILNKAGLLQAKKTNQLLQQVSRASDSFNHISLISDMRLSQHPYARVYAKRCFGHLKPALPHCPSRKRFRRYSTLSKNDKQLLFAQVGALIAAIQLLYGIATDIQTNAEAKHQEEIIAQQTQAIQNLETTVEELNKTLQELNKKLR